MNYYKSDELVVVTRNNERIFATIVDCEVDAFKDCWLVRFKHNHHVDFVHKNDLDYPYPLELALMED